jgi:galactitol-specific phosphotransferase system IIC component
MILGVGIGVFLGILAGYRVRQILELAIHVAAVMFLLPHCGNLIGAGMQPFNLQLKAAIQKVFPHRLGLTVGATSLAPLFTRLAAQAGSATSYSGPITAFTDGGNPLRFWFFHLFQGSWIALVLLAPAAPGLIFP